MKAGRALSTTLSLYVARRFLWWFIAMFGGLFGVIFMGETIELLRRAAAHPEIAPAVISNHFGLDDAPRAFEVASDRAHGAIKVVLHP